MPSPSFPSKFSVSLYLEFKKTCISSNYFRDLKAVLEAWSRDFGTVHPLEISTQKLQQWADWKRETVKVSTVAAYLFSVQKYFDWLIESGVVSRNPAKGVLLPKHRKPFRKVFVSGPTLKMLISECEDPELKYCLFAGFHAGLRFNEVVMSRPEWFSLPEALLHVTRSEDWDTKDGDDRTIPLTRDFLAFLRVYGLKVPFMIAPHKRPGGRHRYRFDFSRRFENYVRSKNVHITFHDTRRTFASLHATAGTSIYKVAKWLGDDVDVVQKHYGHLSPSDPEINRAFSA
jgi:integrase